MSNYESTWTLRMVANQADDLTTAGNCQYQFYVRNAGGYFSDSGWLDTNVFETEIGTDDDLCDWLEYDLNSSADDDLYSLLNWEFCFRVKDDDGNISEASEWKSISYVNLPVCEGVNESLPVYIEIYHCGKETAQKVGECDDEGDESWVSPDGTINSAQNYRWQFNDSYSRFDQTTKVYIKEEDLTFLPSPPFYLSYNYNCYYLPSSYTDQRTNYPSGDVLSLDPDASYDPPAYANPNCTASCWDEAMQIYFNPSAYCTTDDENPSASVYLEDYHLAHYLLIDDNEDTTVTDCMYFNDGTAIKNTATMRSDKGFVFDGEEDYIDCPPRGDDEYEATSSYNPSAYENPSYDTYEFDNPSAQSDDYIPDNPSATQPTNIDYDAYLNPSTFYDDNPSAAVSYEHDTRYDHAQDYTYTIWAKLDNSITDHCYIISDGVLQGWALEYYNGSINLLDLTNPSAVIASASISKNVWTHIAVVLKEGTTGELYINAQLQDSFEGASFKSTDDNFVIGVNWLEQKYYKGYLYDVRIINYDLDSYDLSLIYNSGDGTIQRDFVYTDEEEVHCSFKEQVGNYDDFISYYNACVDECDTVTTSFNPSAYENPSAYDQVFIFNDCEECWTYWDYYYNCEIMPLEEDTLYCWKSFNNSYVYRSVTGREDQPWYKPIYLDVEQCAQDKDECSYNFYVPTYIKIEFTLLSGGCSIGLNGQTIRGKANIEVGKRYEFMLNIHTWNRYVPVDIWALNSEFADDPYHSYISVEDPDEDTMWSMRVSCRCRSFCDDEGLEDCRLYAARLCNCEDYDLPIFIPAAIMPAENMVIKYDGKCYNIDVDSISDIGVFCHYVSDSVILNALPQTRYDTCAECMNDSFCEGMTVYRVYNQTDLENMSNDLEGCYLLMNDITLTGEWDPIGDMSTQFTGNFNGQGHIISNVYINRPGTNVQGFFGGVKDATIKNLGIANATITAMRQAGVLAADIEDSTVSNCYTNGTLNIYYDTTYGNAGGFAGRLDQTDVTDCYADVTINVYRSGAGICYNIGGFVGQSYNLVTPTIERCYAATKINIYADSAQVLQIGGFSGNDGNYAAHYINCYAHGNVIIKGTPSSVDRMGQFLGRGYIGDASHTVTDCYSSVYIPEYGSQSYFGGFCGWVSGTPYYSDCFYNSQFGLSSDADVTALSNSQINKPDVYVAAGWDRTVWTFPPSAAPYLRKRYQNFLQSPCDY